MTTRARIAATALVLGLGVATGSMGWAQESAESKPAVTSGAPSPVALQGKKKDNAKKLVPGEVMVLHATNTGGGIDKEIGSMPQLKKPPFSAYNTYRLLDRQAISLAISKPDSTELPNKRILRTTLKAVVPKKRYRVAASISRPKGGKGKNYLPLLEVTVPSGETFFVAGQSFKGGILVVGIRVGQMPKGKAAPQPKKGKPSPKPAPKPTPKPAPKPKPAP